MASEFLLVVKVYGVPRRVLRFRRSVTLVQVLMLKSGYRIVVLCVAA